MKYLSFVFLACSLVFKVSGSPDAPGDTGIGLAPAVVELTKALAKAEKVKIYQGLPRERDKYAKQKSANICRQITDQWVYALPQEVRFKDVLAVQRLCENGLLVPWRGPKLCGGFHADWAVCCTTEKETIYVLFCFGCHEARIVREGKPFAADLNVADFQVTTDLNGRYFKELATVLESYHEVYSGPAK